MPNETSLSSDSCWDWLSGSRSEGQIELSTRDPVSASVGMKRLGVLPRKSFHSYYGETSRNVKGWWDLCSVCHKEKADCLLQWEETADLTESTEEVWSSGQQSRRGASSRSMAAKVVCCWLSSTPCDAYWIKLFPDWPVYRNKGMTLVG